MREILFRGRRLDNPELEGVKQYEPNLYVAACKIFGPSYEYTRKYRKFKEAYKREKRRADRLICSTILMQRRVSDLVQMRLVEFASRAGRIS